MEKQILISIMVMGTAAAVAGAGTFAFFNDTASVGSNLFTAGKVDLHLNGADSAVTAIIGATLMPGESDSGSVDLTRTTDTPGTDILLDLAFDTVNTDASGGSTDVHKFLKVSAVSYDGKDLLATGACYDPANANGNGNAFVDLADLDGRACTGLGVPKADGAGTSPFSMTVQLDTTASNALQGDATTLTVRFLLRQSADSSTIAP